MRGAPGFNGSAVRWSGAFRTVMLYVPGRGGSVLGRRARAYNGLAMSKRRDDDWFACPHCGAEVPRGARSCPECGSDEKTGWAEDADKWGADIPTGYGEEDEFDYDEFIRREFGRGRKLSTKGWIILIVTALLMLGLVLRFVL